MDSVSGKFYGAPIEHVRGSYQYGRAIFFPGMDSRKLLEQFLREIRDPRFTEIARVLSGGGGKERASTNDLLDAFHVWTAEGESCTHFLTLDFKLIAKVKRAQRLSVSVGMVKPSELLTEICAGEA
jgi:hypothetical protein